MAKQQETAADAASGAQSGKATSETPMHALQQLQEAGLGNMFGMGAAWMEAVGEMSAEVISFVADRIKEDVKTQHEILHCKDIGELQQIQTEFVQKTLDQYQAESGRLVEMGAKTFGSVTKGKVS